MSMDPYAKPNEQKVREQRPKISHLPDKIDNPEIIGAREFFRRRTRKQRQAEKQAVAAERRAIKKSARRHLKKQMLDDLEDIG